jgi:hypothetical protein
VTPLVRPGGWDVRAHDLGALAEHEARRRDHGAVACVVRRGLRHERRDHREIRDVGRIAGLPGARREHDGASRERDGRVGRVVGISLERVDLVARGHARRFARREHRARELVVVREVVEAERRDLDRRGHHRLLRAARGVERAEDDREQPVPTRAGAPERGAIALDRLGVRDEIVARPEPLEPARRLAHGVAPLAARAQVLGAATRGWAAIT